MKTLKEKEELILHREKIRAGSLKKHHYQLFVLCNVILPDFDALYVEYSSLGVFTFILFRGSTRVFCSEINGGHQKSAIEELQAQVMKTSSSKRQ